jgi:hypothetical protein
MFFTFVPFKNVTEMKYIIYELIEHDLLTEIKERGYYESKTHRSVLEVLDVPNVESTHSSLNSATSEVFKHKELLKHKKLTILQVFDINWEGEITVN